jgi:cytochrome c oxidase subunit II
MNDQPARLAEPGLHLFGAASSAAVATDSLFIAMLLLCGVMALVLAGLIVWLCVRYRAGAAVDRSDAPSDAGGLEAAWTVIPLLLFLGIFTWAARGFLAEHRAPPDALPIHVVGKQWMWKLEHGNGRREINELHVPQGRPVDLILASEDAIHSFYVPAFRLKQDAVPGRITHLWFTATRLGEFRLFCSEYCGSEHAGMVGKVTVLSPTDYARWLDAGPAEPGMVQQGFALFRSSGCSGCHDAGSTVHAPLLQGLYGRTVQLQDGRHVVADENYLRDSIVLPGRDVAAGFAPLMPSYAGQFDEAQLQQLVAYLRAGAPSNPSAEDLR